MFLRVARLGGPKAAELRKSFYLVIERLMSTEAPPGNWGGCACHGRMSLALHPLDAAFLGPGFRLGARWNRLVKTVKTRKKREKTEQKWARYGLKGVKEGS